MECPTCKQPFTEFHNQAIGSPENGKFGQKYRPGPPAAPSTSTRRFQNNSVTFTVTAENFIEALINENLVVNNVAQAQALYNLLGIFIAEVERVRAGESRPNYTPDNVRLLPTLYRCRQKYRMMLKMN